MTGILGATIGSYPSGLTLEFVDSVTLNNGTNTSTQTITHPGTVNAGDLMVLFHCTWDNDSDYINADPSGFTEINKNAFLLTTATYLAYVISYEVLPDTTNVITPTPVGTTVDNSHYIALYFRPSRTINTVTISTVNAQSTNSNPTSQTVSASGGNEPLIVFGFMQNNSAVGAFSTKNPAFDNEYTSSSVSGAQTLTSSRVGYKIYNSNAQDHSIDMNDLGANNLVSFYLEVA